MNWQPGKDFFQSRVTWGFILSVLGGALATFGYVVTDTETVIDKLISLVALGSEAWWAYLIIKGNIQRKQQIVSILGFRLPGK